MIWIEFIKYKEGPCTDPCGTPASISRQSEYFPFRIVWLDISNSLSQSLWKVNK